MQEEWRPIAGYEGYYEVSSAGRVRSVDRVVPSGTNSTHLTGRHRAICKTPSGYLFVTLSKNRTHKTFFVHRLVAGAFIGNPGCLPQVAHLDGDPSNNSVPNLSWTTSLTNNRQKGRYTPTSKVNVAVTNPPAPTQETWHSVVGYEDLYEVSDLGRVRSLDHYVQHPRGGVSLCHGVMRRAVPNQGYLMIRLSKDGRADMCSIHHIVAEAFLGPRPPGMDVAHWDGDGLNPRLNNLRYATPKDNNGDKHRHGTQFHGEAVLTHKLTEHNVREIRVALASGASKMSQARMFGVSHKTIRNLDAGLIWREVI